MSGSVNSETYLVSAYTADHDTSFLRNRNPWLAGPLIGGIVAAFIGLSAIAGGMLADRLLQSELNDWPRMVAAQMENAALAAAAPRSEEHTSELQSLMRISYAVFCLKKKKKTITSTRSSRQTLQ